MGRENTKEKREEKNKRKNKNEFKFVENLMFHDLKQGDFDRVLDEVAAIVYSHICQLTHQIDSAFNKNLLTGASING